MTSICGSCSICSVCNIFLFRTCTSTGVTYTTTSSVGYYSDPYSDSYSCGFWGFSRCTRTLYRYQATTFTIIIMLVLLCMHFHSHGTVRLELNIVLAFYQPKPFKPNSNIHMLKPFQTMSGRSGVLLTICNINYYKIVPIDVS